MLPKQFRKEAVLPIQKPQAKKADYETYKESNQTKEILYTAPIAKVTIVSNFVTKPDMKTASTLPNDLEVPISIIKVALLLPLSGSRALLGRELLDAAQLALFDLADANFAIYPIDTEGTAEGAARAAEQAVKIGVKFILGPLQAGSVLAVRPIAFQAKIPVLAFSNSRNVAGEGLYIMGFVPRQQVEAIVKYAISEGLYRYSVLAPQNAYGQAVVDAMQEVVEFHDAVVVRIQFYDPSAIDLTKPTKALADFDKRHKALLKQQAQLKNREDEFSQQVLKRLEKLDTLGDVDYDAILLPASGQQLKAIASLLSYYDVDSPKVRLLGLSNWAHTLDIASEPSLNSGWFAAPPGIERANFFKRYRNTFGRPPAAIASLAYDAMAMAIILARSKENDKFSRNQLIQPHGFMGVDGLFRLQEEGIVERVYEIREVTSKGFTVRRPALTEFPNSDG